MRTEGDFQPLAKLEAKRKTREGKEERMVKRVRNQTIIHAKFLTLHFH